MRDGLRAIHVADLDTRNRLVLLLTREVAVPHLRYVMVAPVTSRIRGVAVEVSVGPANGLDHASVVNLDNVQTIPRDALGRRIGYLLPQQEPALSRAVQAAYDLE